MTIQEAERAKLNAEFEIKKIIAGLMEQTGCSVMGISFNTEYLKTPFVDALVSSEVKIKLEIK